MLLGELSSRNPGAPGLACGIQAFLFSSDKSPTLPNAVSCGLSLSSWPTWLQFCSIQHRTQSGVLISLRQKLLSQAHPPSFPSTSTIPSSSFCLFHEL